MKINLTIELSDADRYSIAKYFVKHQPKRELTATARRRASRIMCREFAKGAIRLALNDRAGAMSGRTRGIHDKLRAGVETVRDDALYPPDERNGNLFA